MWIARTCAGEVLIVDGTEDQRAHRDVERIVRGGKPVGKPGQHLGRKRSLASRLGGLGAQLTKSGISWRAYMEGMSDDCLADVGGYAVKHNPFAYYGAACPSNIVNFGQLSSDLATNPPQFLWIGPDMCHDTHDCSLQTGDAWLASTVPQILASDAWKQNGVLFITWDEDDSSSDTNAVSALVIAPNLKAHTSAKLYDHYSMLATIQQSWRLGCLGNTCDRAHVKPMRALAGPPGL